MDASTVLRLTPEQRAHAFSARFPNYCPVVVHGGRLYTCWVIGPLYARPNGFYGAYPHSVKERIYALFPDCEKVCHLFSGTIHDFSAITYDVNPDHQPTICDDIRNLVKHKDELADVDLFAADPPYEKEDFAKYGLPSLNKWEVIRELGKVAKPHSFLSWLDTRVPMYNKEYWALLGHIGLVVSTNTRMRVLTLFERTEKSYAANTEYGDEDTLENTTLASFEES